MDKRILFVNINRMDKLARALKEATDQLEDFLPLAVDSFDPERMDPHESLYLDGFRARFSDLQDMLGKVVFKSIAQMDEDETPGQELTTRERIVLMEKRGLIDGEQWKDIREIRNSFAHEYPDEHKVKAINLNDAWKYTPILLTVVQRIKDYVSRQYGA